MHDTSLVLWLYNVVYVGFIEVGFALNTMIVMVDGLVLKIPWLNLMSKLNYTPDIWCYGTKKVDH